MRWRVGAAVWAGRRFPPVLAHRLAPRLLPRETAGWCAPLPALFGGAALIPDLHSHNDRRFALYGTGNETGMAFASQVVGAGSVVFEIGANVGTETLALSALVGPGGRVVAVEPVAQSRAMLRARVEAAGAGNVRIVPQAVDAAGTVLRLASYDPRFSGAAHFTDAGSAAAESESAAAVRAVTLDALCAEHGVPGCVFLDIEGFEHRALRGGLRLLGRHRPFLFLEADSEYLARAGSGIADLHALLQAHAYLAYSTASLALREVRSVPVGRRVHEDWAVVPAERQDVVPRLRSALLRMRLTPRIRGLNPLAHRPR